MFIILKVAPFNLYLVNVIKTFLRKFRFPPNLKKAENMLSEAQTKTK